MEHEIDEILGGGVGPVATWTPFPKSARWTCSVTPPTARTRNWRGLGRLPTETTPTFPWTGQNLWVRFNGLLAGDLGDFWGFNQDPVTYLPLYWSPPGVTPHAEVQDAWIAPQVTFRTP